MTSARSSEMLHLINGYQVSRAIFIAASLGLADLIRNGCHTCAELAVATNTAPSALHRVIRVLASAGVFSLSPDERVTMTDLASSLLSDVPGSLRGWAVDQLGGEHYEAWGALMHSVSTGQVAFEHVYGQNAWAHRADHPASAKAFDEGMASFTAAHHRAVIEAYPFANHTKLYDIGGGDGQFMEALLLSNPGMHGLIFDLPYVVPRARKRIETAGLSHRCEVTEGNIFERLPTGGSAYLLSRMIHDWNDEKAKKILAICHQAMNLNGVLLLVERVMPDLIEPCSSTRALAVSDLNMLVMTGGLERTRTQYENLLFDACFEVTSITSSGTSLSIIEARAIRTKESLL
jgi:hypothetical protein